MSAATRTVVRCPRCGSTGAESVEEIGIEFARMKCDRCACSEICDEHAIRLEWNEAVPAGYVVGPCLLPSRRFGETWAALGATGGSRAALDRLRAAYDDPSRAYHTSLHVGSCLALLDDPRVASLAKDLPEVEAALWFHDAVYDTRASDNEARSAALAEEVLLGAGAPRERVERVAAHVRATKDHVALTGDAALVIDVDLSILGADAETYARFEEEIRREYGWVEPAAFRAGRAAVLRRFLDRPFIYATPVLRDRFEARARENLASAIARLSV
ncbi:MAG: hypothetical protein KF819_19335 [Labilithrix sp.]|nr:hypothetical protein [Labilithrix sp.]